MIRTMELLSWIAILIFAVMALNAGLILRWRLFVGEWPSKKVMIWSNIGIVIIFILFAVLPKNDGNCTVKIKITNKNSNSEIIINKQYTYHLTDNQKITLDDLSSHGSIAIKTNDDARIVVYFDEGHPLVLKHTIRIFILNDKIMSIDVFPKLAVDKMADGVEMYDKVIELFRNEK